MTSGQTPLTPSGLMGAATEVLVEAGYAHVQRAKIQELSGAQSRVFEDAYGVAAVSVFDSWSGMRDGWPEIEASFAGLLSAVLSKGEPKTWDTYLILLTPARLPASDSVGPTDIRHDTRRVRKLVATGEDLRVIEDVRTALLPILPLAIGRAGLMPTDSLERLPRLIERKSLSRALVEALVQAFRQQEPLMETLRDVLQEGRPE